ncbi:flavin reductase [Thiohalocapsa halophila]|uniref:Flavin reductase n=1 Tax=Thiohalocapsa halophila TaxID=69359 RepID=A0ABS1CFZ0_9GAMM|nr:flavin reductase family protein [Thiohalocapsa halophila]MBK1630643.1 flavin reductase [Thiohalocapsa halophila]
MTAIPPEPSHPQPLDKAVADAVNAVHHLYDPPLWLVTAAESPQPGSTRGGCIATFVARASIVRDRPRMLAGIARQHHTWRMIEASGRFAVYLLPEQALGLVWRFGLASGKHVDKYADLPDTRTPLGNPSVDGPIAWLDCQVEQAINTGDRSLYVAAVTGGGVLAEFAQPLTAGRLMALAPADKRAELDRLYARDGGIDAAAIDAWRATHLG